MSRCDSNDYQRIFLDGYKLIDVRAPVEFSAGAFPNSINLPILFDDEREAVGTCYKKQGQNAAIALGHKLVCGDKKAARVALWQEACAQNPLGYLYCFRGGLRSQLAQTWLAQVGVDYPRVVKGYKALRNYLLEYFNQCLDKPMIILSGNTGSGKTVLINALVNGVDLEGYACHRGSSFGRTLVTQPSQLNFENTLIINLLHKIHAKVGPLVLEDEGHTLGANHLPIALHQVMAQNPLVIIDEPFEARLARIEHEYIIEMAEGFRLRDGEAQGWKNYSSYLHNGLFTIRKRLGLERFKAVEDLLNTALVYQKHHGDSHAHRTWLAILLREYYDPKYTYQLEKKQARIIFRGDYAAVKDFLEDRYNSSMD